MTITIQIGNTDNKLTQQEWANFVDEVDTNIKHLCSIEFFGGSNTYAPWQNVAWVANIDKENLFTLCVNLTRIRIKYKQESVAITEGVTNFI